MDGLNGTSMNIHQSHISVAGGSYGTGLATAAPRRWNFCADCGVKLETQWKYCTGCGKQIPAVSQFVSGTCTVRGDEQWTPTTGPFTTGGIIGSACSPGIGNNCQGGPG